MATAIAPRIFSVTDYHRMRDAGILTEDDRVELIEGSIVVMSPIGSGHAACVKRLNTLLSQQISDAALISVQDPIELATISEPEPDVALLRMRDDFYSLHHPTAADVLLVIEVADTSEAYDRDEKVPMYARAGIPEVWLISVVKQRIEVYTESRDGIYRQVRVALAGDILTPQQLPHVHLPVTQIVS